MNKYNAKKTEYAGRIFDSRKEAKHAMLLDTLRSAKDPSERVANVEYQPAFDLVVNGVKVCQYRADFKVVYGDKRVEIVDVKGMKKGCAYQLFKLKKKLLKACQGIDVIEV